jgi:hypothetical protein
MVLQCLSNISCSNTGDVMSWGMHAGESSPAIVVVLVVNGVEQWFVIIKTVASMCNYISSFTKASVASFHKSRFGLI